jgi:hypothetical protein
VNDSSIFAGTDSGVLISTNNGTSWTPVDSGLPPNTLVKSLALSGSSIFAGTYASGIWSRPLSEMVGVINRPHSYGALNPLSREILVRQVSSKDVRFVVQTGASSLRVFDVRGQLLANLFVAGNQAVWHCQQSAGTFIVKAANSPQSATKTFVLAR